MSCNWHKFQENLKTKNGGDQKNIWTMVIRTVKNIIWCPRNLQPLPPLLNPALLIPVEVFCTCKNFHCNLKASILITFASQHNEASLISHLTWCSLFSALSQTKTTSIDSWTVQLRRMLCRLCWRTDDVITCIITRFPSKQKNRPLLATLLFLNHAIKTIHFI